MQTSEASLRPGEILDTTLRNDQFALYVHAEAAYVPSSRGIVALFKRISLVGVPAGSLRHLRLFLFGFLSRHKSAKPQRFFQNRETM